MANQNLGSSWKESTVL